jgi:hypothetical protein
MAINNKYEELISSHAMDILDLFIVEQNEFGIVCFVEDIKFIPDLSNEIKQMLSQSSFFMISGYGLENAFIDNDMFVFEAGFGEENSPSRLHIPISDITQIVVDNAVIFVNPNIKQVKQKSTKELDLEHSINMLLLNNS